MHESVRLTCDALVKRSGGTVLLHGVAHLGKRALALNVARRLNCDGCSDATCRSCKMALGGNHPNIIVIDPDEKGKIGIEAVHELQHALQFEQYQAGGRAVVLADAHTLTLPAQHALLKTLEEPPRGTTILLTSNALTALLPTVLSRCTAVYVSPLPKATLATYLEQQMALPSLQASQIAELANGAIGLAHVYAKDDEARAQQQEIIERVKQLMTQPHLFERLTLAASMAGRAEGRAAYVSAIECTVRRSTRGSQPQAAKGLAALLRLRERLQANVSPKTAFEALAVELA